MDLQGELIEHPYSVYERLRDTAPVCRITGTDGTPAWLVTRYEDVREALADPRLSLDKSHAGEGAYRGFALPPALDANLLNMDPPDHTRMRGLVARAFTSRRVEQLRTPIRTTADRLLDQLGSAGSADLVAAYAGSLPSIVICDLLGVPENRRLDFRGWTEALVAPDPAQPGAVKAALVAMLGFLTELVAHKRRQPADDLLSDLIAVRDTDGDRLSEDELMSVVFLVLFAGMENTTHLIGNAIHTLLRHPEHLALLRDDPSRLPAAIAELARLEGPALLAIRRFPTEDVTIAGVTVPAGETVLLSLSAANRDPARFSQPDTLDFDRDTSGHLALGHGIHYCLGGPLARVETEIALAALLDRYPTLELLESAPQWRRSLRSRGLKELPVRYQAARDSA
ncbi:cytochrome P450 family protein [Streptomyces sp. H27-H5]|uniref:cytochrome P450 family protein n=1 Tax=Streptomyces sp. H27-H5 TaxID=2996460 RepID=UPI00226FB534|nr:cytochrome P450 [Streptomyces sp. H27-H5]MCY0961288.1 cytochrome P450 [Streptomyces sp. H27-H5]